MFAFTMPAGLAEWSARCRWPVPALLRRCGAESPQCISCSCRLLSTSCLLRLPDCPWLTAASQSPPPTQRPPVRTTFCLHPEGSTRAWNRCCLRSSASYGPSSRGLARGSQPRCTGSAQAGPPPPLWRSSKQTLREEITGITRRGPFWRTSRVTKT